MKKLLCSLVLITCFFSTTVFAGDLRTNELETLKQTRQDTALIMTRLMVDLQLSYLERNAVKLMDLRISPMIRYENYFETPIEMGFLLTEEQIPLALRGFEESSGEKMSVTPRAITAAVSAESDADGKPFLTITVFAVLSNNAASVGDSSIQKAFAAFSKVSSFSPQIKKGIASTQAKKVESAVTVSNGTWVTNMRIDSDKRLQITGYATEARLVNQLCRELEKTGTFSELWLSSMTRNVYEKHPVMRFDLTGRIIDKEN